MKQILSELYGEVIDVDLEENVLTIKFKWETPEDDDCYIVPLPPEDRERPTYPNPGMGNNLRDFAQWIIDHKKVHIPGDEIVILLREDLDYLLEFLPSNDPHDDAVVTE